MNLGSILLVEDDPDDMTFALRVLHEAFPASGVAVAGDGREALEILFERHVPRRELPGLVVLDLGLPHVVGLAVLQRMRDHEDTRAIPVVVLSGSIEQEDRLRAYADGATVFLRKPIDGTRLLCALQLTSGGG